MSTNSECNIVVSRGTLEDLVWTKMFFINHLNSPIVDKIPKPQQVLFNPPATIVFWNDGTKTVVKTNNESFDEEKGFLMAYVKKLHGNKGNFNNFIKKAIGNAKYQM